MKERKLLELLADADEKFIEEANPAHKVKKPLYAVRLLAACLVLTVLVGTGVHFFSPVPGGDRYYMATLDEVAAAYDGVLLLEKIPFTGASRTNVQLCYNGDAPLHAPGWKNLSVSASFDTYDVTVACTFDEKPSPEKKGEGCRELFYGDTKVYVYKTEGKETYEASYYAAFSYDGVFYEVRTNSDDSEKIYEVLETVLGKPDGKPDENPGTPQTPHSNRENTFTNILGYSGYYVKIEETAPGFIIWKYYAEIDGTEKCIAEVFGYAAPPEPEAYSVDIDGDGTKELICNCLYGTGAQRVFVYRNQKGVIEQGWLAYDRGNTQLFPNMNDWGANAVNERYNPEKGVFEIEYSVKDEMEMAVTVLPLQTDIQYEVFVEEP